VDAIAQNESHFDPCALHRLGPREKGLGMVGLMTRFHRAKWDPNSPDWIFHLPEHSAIVMARFMRRAVDPHWRRRPAKTWVGFLYWYRGYDNPAGDARFCERTARRGVDCHAKITGLGKRLGKHPEAGQDRWLFSMLRKAPT
jgi:hypothetical protein